ncbi:hypothetical protein SLA2020_401270 [Shorea laevis]
MVEVASEGGTRRRLPSWMLGVSAADKVRKSDNGDQNDTVKVEGHVTSRSKAKRKPGKADLHQKKEAFVASSDELSKPAKRRKRKLNGQDAECDAEIALKEKKSNAERREVQESSLGGKMKAEGTGFRGSKDIEIPSPIDDGSKLTVNAETAVQKKKNNRVNRKAWGSTLDEKVKIVGIGCEGSKDFGIPSPVDDDDELTVEDLISIAKEYVKADKDVETPKSLNLDCELERQFPATASYRNESEGCLNASNSTQRSPTHEAASNNSTVCPANEHSSINTSRTGDPVQDMLDLYLGHLLNKPVEEQRTESITKDVAVANDLEKQSLNDVQEERVPTLKKKRSLRDKVALLFD